MGRRNRSEPRLDDVYSARISLGYRALAVRDGDMWVWFWIGNHGDYDSLPKRL